MIGKPQEYQVRNSDYYKNKLGIKTIKLNNGDIVTAGDILALKCNEFYIAYIRVTSYIIESPASYRVDSSSTINSRISRFIKELTMIDRCSLEFSEVNDILINAGIISYTSNIIYKDIKQIK